MGDNARMDRCQRFCEEFGEDMMSALTRVRGHECRIGTHFGTNTVHAWVTVVGHDYMDPDTIFEPDYDLIEDDLTWIADLLNTDIDTVISRLKNAELLDE